MPKNPFKINDIVCIEPFGECPTHYCRIDHFYSWPNDEYSPIFAMGTWYSKSGNCLPSGFDAKYCRLATEQDLNEAIASKN
jgi:hypothetical protein